MKEIKPAFEKNNVPVCFFSDDYYVPYLGTAVYSAIMNASGNTNLDILIFENGYSENNRTLLRNMSKNKRNVSIRFVDMMPFLKKLSVNPSKRVSVNCFAKIFCTDKIFRNYQRIIALDSDLLVLQDMMELYQSDMGGKMFAAVRDVYADIMIEKGYHTDQRLNYMLLGEYFRKIGLDAKNYFNSGVIMFDIKKCQMENVQDKMIGINNRYPTMMYAAQDDLNLIFKGRWMELDAKWNVQNPYSLCGHADSFPQGYTVLMENAAILHFLGKSKPWDDVKVWKAEVFDQYALQTAWRDEYLDRRKRFEKKNRYKMFLLPKGSKRREIFLKVYFNLQRKRGTRLFTCYRNK